MARGRSQTVQYCSKDSWNLEFTNSMTDFIIIPLPLILTLNYKTIDTSANRVLDHLLTQSVLDLTKTNKASLASLHSRQETSSIDAWNSPARHNLQNHLASSSAATVSPIVLQHEAAMAERQLWLQVGQLHCFMSGVLAQDSSARSLKLICEQPWNALEMWHPVIRS